MLSAVVRAPATQSAPLLFDHRESRSGIPRRLEKAGVPHLAVDLPVGDYVVSDRVIVERKTGADLAASIKDRRLFEQTERMAEAYPIVVLVVEGQPTHISEASWQAALGRAVLMGAGLVMTEDAEQTAGWLARLYGLEGKGPSHARGRPRSRRPTEDLARTAEDLLQCLPGISTVGAARLLAHFGSLTAVFAADEDALREVAGIGPVRAGLLASLFVATPEAG
jgi:ERCC4-type nuclease